VEISQNKILVAQPFLPDPFFRRTVILLAEHDAEHSMGFIVNKPLKIKLGDLLSNLSESDFPVYHGGPVAQDQLFFLHRHNDKIKDSHPIGNGFYWNGDYGDMIRLVLSKKLEKHSIKFFIGYSGWGSGQLADEFSGESWYLSSPDYALLMKNGHHEIWGAALKQMESPYANLAKFPDGLWMN
jgi:putative transcriptional regulator